MSNLRIWKTKTFTTQAAKDKWLSDNAGKYQIINIFINNGYGVEYRPRLVIDIR